MPHARDGGGAGAGVGARAVDKDVDEVADGGADGAVLDVALPEVDVVHRQRLGVQVRDQLARLLARAVGDAPLRGQLRVLDDAADELVAVLAGVEARLDEPQGLDVAVVRHVYVRCVRRVRRG